MWCLWPVLLDIVSMVCWSTYFIGFDCRDNNQYEKHAVCGRVCNFTDYNCKLVYLCPGVPRIFSDDKESELPDFTSVPDVAGVQLSPILNYLRNSRINVNIRQVH